MPSDFTLDEKVVSLQEYLAEQKAKDEELNQEIVNRLTETGITRLNLGCNRNILPGWINVDLVNFPGVDVRTNLTEKWPWGDSTVDYIRAYDLIEHLPDHIFTMNEAWRVMKLGATFEILVPSTDGRGAWQDPTHVSFWNLNSFYYYQVIPDENGVYRSHPNRRLYAPHLIQAAFEIHAREIGPTADGVMYVGAKLIKCPDPGDCEPPDERDRDRMGEEGDPPEAS